MLRAYSDALGIPLLPVPTAGETYHLAMERSLKKAAALGAEVACFGDIDIERNRAWCEARCQSAGLKAVFPLWHRDRGGNVRQLVALGYQCLIKSINNTLLPKSLLGRIIDADVIAIMRECGIDICGENGEYHALVMNGPVFRRPLAYQTGEILDFGDYSVIEVTAE